MVPNYKDNNRVVVGFNLYSWKVISGESTVDTSGTRLSATVSMICRGMFYLTDLEFGWPHFYNVTFNKPEHFYSSKLIQNVQIFLHRPSKTLS